MAPYAGKRCAALWTRPESRLAAVSEGRLHAV